MMRFLKLLVLATLMIGLLAGCGGSSGSTNVKKPTATASAVTPVPQKPGTTKISFWYGVSGHNSDVMQMMINKYNLSQSKYYVTGIFQTSYDDTLSKFNASLAGRELPNVVQIYDVGTQRMIDSKKIIPIQDLANQDNFQTVINDLEPAIRSYYTIGGKLYSMPFNSSTAVMYFDKNAFKAVGLDPNKKTWTFDELAAAAKKLTVKDASGKVTRAGAAIFGYAWLLEQEEAIHNQLYATPDNGRTSRATKYVFNNSTGVQYLESLKQMLKDGTAKYYGSNGDPAQNAAASAFLNGQAAIDFASIASLRNFVDTAKKNGNKVDVGVAYMPRRSDAQGRNIIGGASLWLTNTGTKEQQAGAWDFVKFTAQTDTQVFWAANTGYVPIRVSAYDTQDMKDTLAHYPQFQAAIDQIRAAPTNYSNAGSVSGNLLTVRNYIQQGMDDYLSGRVNSAQTVLDKAARQSNDSLEEYNTSNQ